MIDFRYHVVSIVAVFLALAVGLLIGSTTLRPAVAHDLKNRTDNLASRNGDLRTTNSDLKQQISADDAFASAVLPYVVGGRLAGTSVVVVSTPDASDQIHGDLVDALGQAGATVSADVQLRDPLLDPTQDAFLSSLVSRLKLGGGKPAQAGGSERALALLASALVNRPDKPGLSDADATQVLSAFSAGKLVSVNGQSHEAQFVVVLTGSPPTATATPTPSVSPTPTAALLPDFVTDLAHGAAGVVVTGPADATGPGGLIAALTSSDTATGKVSTVAGADRVSGVIATVLAVAAERNGVVGHYDPGTTGKTPVPSLTPGT